MDDLSQQLAAYDLDPDEHLPPEALLDPYHPGNDGYYRNLRDAQRLLMAAKRHLRPKHLIAVKAHFAGKNNAQIAEQLNVTPNTVSRWLKQPPAKRVLALLRHYDQLHNGPTEQHRRNILYRILIDNEKERPNIAISAVQELNRMTGAYAADKTVTNSPTINIVVQHPVLQRGPLDGA